MLKQNLLSGDARTAHMRVILMEMLLGDSPKAKKVAEQVAQMQARPTPLDIIPSVARLLPAVDDLLKAIGEGDADATDADLQQLSNRLGNLRSVAPRSTVASLSSVPTNGDTEFAVSQQLEHSLSINDVANSIVFAEKLEGLIKVMVSKHEYINNYALDLYIINDARGRAAFQKGDYRAATDYLNQAAAIPSGAGGTLMLDYFGPNMWLAEQLLRVGKKEEVLKFLQTCKERFWLHGNEKADRWITTIQGATGSDLSPNSDVDYGYSVK